MYGVRYPGSALELLDEAGIEYGGYLPSYRVPAVFARYNLTVHVPRRPYAEALPGIPTIRPFEAMACGIPLLSAPWKDTDNLFRERTDYLMARDGEEMGRYMQEVLQDKEKASALSHNGLETIRRNHTCAHRVDQLLKIYTSLVEDQENCYSHRFVKS
jgi:spore maturation protein CgeB